MTGQYGPWITVRVLEAGPAVEGLSPADGSSTMDTTPELSWGEVNAAAKYQIQIADSVAGLNSSPTVGYRGKRDELHTCHGVDQLAEALLAGESTGWGWAVWGVEYCTEFGCGME